jgi:hypothetical protein
MKPKPALENIVLTERIEQRIFQIRGQAVMLAQDLAELYEVPVKQLNQAVRRNAQRFPDDFMFQLSWEEARILRSQFVTLGGEQPHFRYRPNAFTEQGVAMLSAVLQSSRAVAVSIEIVRVFVRLRKLLSAHDALARKLSDLESRMTDHDGKFSVVFDAIRQLIEEDGRTRRKPPIGFHTEAEPPRKAPGRSRPKV